MRYNCISGANNTPTFRTLARLIRNAATLLEDFRDELPEFEPFCENEPSAVSLLIGAAARAGYLPIAEYRIRKEFNGKPGFGRVDLSFVANHKNYSFEFKRCDDAGDVKNLNRMMALASSDIAKLTPDEYDYAFAGLIAPVYDHVPIENYKTFNDGGLAFWIGQVEPEVFFYFREYKR